MVGRQGSMKLDGAFFGRPRELRTRHNISANIAPTVNLSIVGKPNAVELAVPHPSCLLASPIPDGDAIWGRVS